jgi:hypothetical protein
MYDLPGATVESTRKSDEDMEDCPICTDTLGFGINSSCDEEWNNMYLL